MAHAVRLLAIIAAAVCIACATRTPRPSLGEVQYVGDASDKRHVLRYVAPVPLSEMRARIASAATALKLRVTELRGRIVGRGHSGGCARPASPIRYEVLSCELVLTVQHSADSTGSGTLLLLSGTEFLTLRAPRGRAPVSGDQAFWSTTLSPRIRNWEALERLLEHIVRDPTRD